MRTHQTAPKDIDQYIAGFPKDVQEVLEKIRMTIRNAAPDAEETIKYQMPTFTLRGNLVHFAAFKKHIGFYPPVAGATEFKNELSVYEGAKGSLKFPFDKPIPYDLISKIVKFRVKENMERAEAKGKKRDEYKIVYVDKPEWEIIGGGIQNYNTQQAGNDKGKNLCFVLRAPDQEIVGGVIGATYWDWLYINLMWVKEELRGRGYGHRLLTCAEEEARQRGAKNAYLDTFSFQAPEFYKKYGYRVFGELQDFPPGHQRYFLTKQL